MSSYKSDYPSVDFDPAYKAFFEQFYQISDTPDAHEIYAEQFSKSARLVMASRTVNGRAEILALRKGMWEKVAKRRHDPVKVYPFGPNADECMLYGIVAYELKAGGSFTVDWAARALLTKEDGIVKLADYQVYLDTAAMTSKS